MPFNNDTFHNVHRRNEAASRPKSEHIPKRVTVRRSPSPYDDNDSGSYNFNNAPAYASSRFSQFFFLLFLGHFKFGVSFSEI